MLYVPDGAILEQFFWDRSTLSCIQGPQGSGTSSACCHKIWVVANEQLPDRDGVRRSRWLVVRESYPKLKETTIKTWLEWFPENEWGEFRWSTPFRHILKRAHPSGDGTMVECEVIFIAVDSVEVAQALAASFEITGFWINEAQFTEKGVVDEFMGRTARFPSMKNGPGATWYGGILDLNAPIEGHWIPYMRGDLPLPKEWTDDRKAMFAKPPGWTFFVQPPGLIERPSDRGSVYEENPAAENTRWLRKSYLEQIQGKDKEWIDRFVLNKVGLYSEGKPVYPNFSEHAHIAAQDIQFVTGAEVFVGLDFGRDPSAVAGQCFHGQWRVLAELPGDNEPASYFAPRVKRWLAAEFPGAKFVFGGDPRGGDRTQVNDTTAYDIFRNHGMTVIEATSDNDKELRRSAVNEVLMRRDGLQVSPRCVVLKTGMNGGYHYPPIRGTGGFSERPKKNRYSHTCEAFENMILIGGEGTRMIVGSAQAKKPIKMPRRRVILRKFHSA